MSLTPSATIDCYYDPTTGQGEVRNPTATAGSLPTGVTVVSATCTVSQRMGPQLGSLTCTVSSPSAYVSFNTAVYKLGTFLLEFALTLSTGVVVMDLIEVNVWPPTSGA